MPTVGEVARVTIVSGEMPADEVAKAAWLLWKSCRTEIDRKRLPSMASSEGVPGNRLDGSLVKHIIDLWPEYLQWDTEIQTRFRGTLYSYLKGTNNAHCLSPTKKPIWWISQIFSKIAIEKVYGGSTPRSRQQARAEAKLTPHEAGEDRDPAPVTVTQPGKVAAQPMPEPESVPRPPSGSREALQSVHDRRRGEREKRRAETLKAVKEMKEPATVEEIVKALAKAGYNAEQSTVRMDLNYLMDQGLVFTRVETREERTMRAGGMPQKAQRARLFWPKENVPTRTLREVVPGFVVVNKPSGSPDRKARYKIAVALRGLIRRAPFSANELADSTDVAVGTIRHYLTEYAKEGLINQVDVPKGKSGLQKFYRVSRQHEMAIRELARVAQEKLNKANGNGRAVTPTPAPAPAVETPVLSEQQTPTEQHALRIIDIIQEEGTQRENVLMAKADLERNDFNQAIQLLIAGKWLKRFEVTGATYYGSQEPVISDPPPSVATAAITEVEAASDLEEGFALIRKAFEARTGTDPRVPELEAEIADLKARLRKATAALSAALAG